MRQLDILRLIPPADVGRLGGVFVLVVVVWVSAARGQSSLPVVEGADGRALRAQCGELLGAMATMKVELPKETEQELRALVNDDKKASDETAEKIQKLLNAQCLVGVSINPESRVKAARGPRSAELVAGKEAFFIIRVLNEAGVTHPLSVQSPQLRMGGDSSKERWLEAVVRLSSSLMEPGKTKGAKLTGQKVEYLLLRLKAQEPGKREATLVFDVGQGTQDLGFRAEVPILFTIRR